MIPVTYKTDPFDFHPQRLKVKPGITIQEIVEQITDYPAGFVVCINGRRIDREWWPRVRPKVIEANSNKIPCILTVHPALGSDSVKSILGVVAAVALVVGASLISGGALTPILGAGFAAGTFGATAAAAGFALAGSLALTALTAPPLAANAQGGGAGVEAKQIAGVSGNSLSPGEYLPMVLGRMRASPPPLMPAYTTLESGEIFVQGIVGLAGAYELSDIWLNGSPVEEFEDFTYSTRQGLPGDTEPAMNFTYAVQEQQPRLKLSQAKRQNNSIRLVDETTPANSYSDWHVYNLPPPGDTGKFVLRLHWPGGMNSQQSDNDIVSGGVAFRVEIKPRSSSTWYKLPEMVFHQNAIHTGEIRQQITLQWGSVTTGAFVVDVNETAWAAYYKSQPASSFERLAEAVYNPGAGQLAKGVTNDSDGFTIEVDNTAMDGDEEYDLRIRMSNSFTESAFNTTTYVYSGGADLIWNHVVSGAQRITSAKATSPGEFVYLESISSWNVNDPFDWRGLSSISFKAKGLQIESLSAEYISIVPVWDGISWANMQATQNPAALYRFVLLSTDFNAQPLPGEVLDEENILEWFQHCQTMEYECNAAIQNESLPDVLQLIAATGWASPRYGDLWGVVMEKDRSDEEPIQMITPLNSRDVGTIKEYPRLPHALRAEFFSDEEEYDLKDDIVAYAPGFTLETATIYESIRYDGFTDPTKVLTRAQFDINQMYMRSIRAIKDVHHEGFVSPRGSLVGVVDDVIKRTHRYSMITEVLTNAGNVVGFRLESILDLQSVAEDIFAEEDPFALTDPFTGNRTLGVAVRLNDGTFSEHQIAEVVDTDILTLTTPVSDTGQFEPSQIIAVGVMGHTYRRMLVMGIEAHQGGEMFRLYLADERPELHAA